MKLSKSSAQICWYPPNLFATLTQNTHCVRINWVVVLPTDLHNFSWIGVYFEIMIALDRPRNSNGVHLES